MLDNYYNKIAKGYDSLYKEEQLIKLNKAISNLDFKIASDMKVLDVGCGTGVSSDFFNDKFGCEVVGIDPSIDLIKQNKNKKSKLIEGFAEELSFEDSSFDLIVSFTAIQNFSDLDKGLEEIKRVGKEKFILTVLNRGENISKIDSLIKEKFNVKNSFEDNKDNYYIIE